MTKTKTLNREAMLRNINGLSLGDRAYCGPYGTIKCTTNKKWHPNPSMSVPRKFSVSGCTNGILKNRGNYTMKQIREAICK